MGGGETGQRAGNHHALDPKVQDARTLYHQFAKRGEQDRCGRGQKQQEDGKRVDHAVIPRTMRKRVSRSKPKRKNSSIP